MGMHFMRFKNNFCLREIIFYPRVMKEDIYLTCLSELTAVFLCKVIKEFGRIWNLLKFRISVKVYDYRIMLSHKKTCPAFIALTT